MNHKIKLALTVSVLGLVASCGGSGSTVSQTADGWQVDSGIAQKGPLLRGSSVTVAELSTTTLQPSGKTYPFEVLDDSGTFKPTNITFTSSFLESTALGYYFNELTGVKSSDMVFLRGLSNLATGQDTSVNVNVLSSFTNRRIKNLFNTAPKKTFAVARPQAEKELLAGFFIYNAVDLMPGTTVGGVLQPKTFMELDLSKKRAADQILAAMSAVIVNAGQTGSGVNYLINQIEMDLADDGLLNNSTKFAVSVASQLNAAVQTTDFAAAALNLNNFYGTTYTETDLSQWIDTSGGIDQVINKYKFSTANVGLGTESKSPDYVAGTEDAGQCFSVSRGKLYRNGTLITTGTVKAVKGDRFVIGLTPNTADNLTGFIQRSAASVAGVCPAVIPTNGLIRVQKYTTTGNLYPASLLILDGAKDTSFNSFPLTFSGMGITKTVLDPWGNQSPVMAFDGGANSYITVPFTTSFGTSDFTIDMWVYVPSGTTRPWTSLISDWSNAEGPLNIQLSGANLSPNWVTNPSKPWGGQGQSVFTYDAWHHLAITRNSGVFNYWVNGKFDFSDSGGLASAVVPGDGTLFIGHQEADGYAAFEGYIPALRIIPGHALFRAPFIPPAGLNSYKKYYP